MFRIVLTLAGIVLYQWAQAGVTDAQYQRELGELATQVSLGNLKAHAGELTQPASRLTGSQGEAKALRYAEAQLTRFGATPRRYPFQVTVPDEASIGTLSVNGKAVRVYPLWPNLVRTSTCDVSGGLLYGGDGTLEALRGKSIAGKVVVLEMGSGATWKNAAKLGAKAVVFLEPRQLMRGDAETKYSAVPVDFPRFYLPLRGAIPMLAAAQRGDVARLSCRQDWVARPSALVVAEFPGQDRNALPVELFASVDSMSVIPGLAPGAESSLGASAALEIARIFSRRPHQRTLRVIFGGGHAMALGGARERTRLALSGELPAPQFTLTLDLSSGSRSLGSYARGWFYDYRNEAVDNIRDLSRTLRRHAEQIATFEHVDNPKSILVDATNDGDGRTWKNNVPGKFALDSEPMVMAGLRAITLLTIEDDRNRVDTPFDTLDQVDFANVVRQVRTIAGLTQRVLNDPISWNPDTSYRLPVRDAQPGRMSLVGGFARLFGRVVEYDPQKSFVPDSPISHAIVVALPHQKTSMGVRNEMLQMTGDDARYSIEGAAPVSAFSPLVETQQRLQAFHVDPTTGQIDRAASWGTHGNDTYKIVFKLTTGERESPIVVFPCVQVSVYDMIDPHELLALPFAFPVDAQTGSMPQDYGEYTPEFNEKLNAEIEDSQAIFFPPGQRFRLLGGKSEADIRMVLTGSDRDEETGGGYVAPGTQEKVEGRQAEPLDGVFSDLPLHVAEDLIALNEVRITRFRKYRMISPGIDRLHGQAKEELAAAQDAKGRMDWPEADRHARAAWGYALRAHPVIQKTTNDVVNGVVFYLFLLIPFAYFLERLIFGHQLLSKQLGAAVGIFLASFVLLRLIHPAFEIVQNPLMIFVAFIMGTLSLVVVSFILGKFEASLRAVRKAQTGVHEIDVKRSSVAMAAFALGVGNMRRRKARTVLTTLTLVVMTFIVLSFTSIVSDLQLKEMPSDTPGRYPGLLLRNPGLDPMQAATYRELANEFSGRATVVRRVAFYGADIGQAGALTVSRADRSVDVRALAGFDPGEGKLMRPQAALLPGGRWFRPGERNVAILPAPLALSLKVEPDEVGRATVRFAGTDYRVIGIADSSYLRNLVDLDGDGFLPADFSLSEQFQQANQSSTQAFRSYQRLDPATVLILPAATTLNLGGDIRTLAVGFANPSESRPALDSLMPRLRMNLYASIPQGGELAVRQFSVMQGSSGSGWLLVVVQLLIASVFVLNTMVASVFERTKEIAIFSSIGLAPNHIGMLFFAESTVYGVLGAVIGYFVAQATAKVIVATQALPGLVLNFSSTSAVMSAAVVMGVVLLSTIYPARKAAQIAAPARDEEAFSTEPEGDVWRLPLPFSIGASEAAPLLRFLGEWFRGYEEYTIGDFVTSGTAFRDEEDGVVAVEATAWLAPYDLGISQRLRLEARPAPIGGVYMLDILLTRLAGDPENWPNVNRRFLANLRRQFLTWRTLDPESRAKYGG